MAALNRPSDDQVGPPMLYLLFAGRHGHPAPGVGSLVAAFASRDEACAAFRQTRLQVSDREGWAELTVVAEGSGPKLVRWFGVDRPRRRDRSSTWLSASARAAMPAPRRRSPFRALGRRTGG